MTRYERLGASLTRARDQIKKGGRIGVNSMVTSAGGVAGGFIEAKFPVIPNTTLRVAPVVGIGLVVAGIANFFDEMSDSVAAGGAGMLAYAGGKEAEQYFSS